MKVLVRDKEALDSIPTTNVRAYLRSRDWTDIGLWGERPINIFTKEHGGRTWEILVPHEQTVGGYAENMSESLSILSAVEDRSELDIYYDIADDATRARSVNGNARVGSQTSQS